MAKNSSNSPNRGWRNDAKPTPSSTTTQGKRKWQQTAQPAQLGKQGRKRIKVFLAGSAFLIVVGAFLWWMLMPVPPRTACLVLIGSGYEENLTIPHNAYGWKGLQDLADAAERVTFINSRLPWVTSQKLRLLYGPQEVTADTTWEKVWNEVLAQPFDEKSVIVFLSLHGGADGQGAYLLPNDVEGKSRININTVLESLKSPALADKNKILLLDATQLTAHWPTGMLHNDFITELKELEDKIKETEGLFVICSSDVDQQSWSSEQWQRTIFGHYVIEGLKGAADTGNSRVTVKELFDYVHRQVKNWATSNRDAIQTPILLGDVSDAEDVELVQVKTPYSERSPSEAEGLKSLSGESSLVEAWNNCQKLRTQVPAPYVYTPHLWRAYQDALLRYEQLLRAGVPADRLNNLKGTLSQLEARIQESRQLLLTPASLSTSFSMPAMLGMESPWSSEELKPRFEEFWQARDGSTRQKKWDQLMAWAQQYDVSGDKFRRILLETDLSKHIFREISQNKNLTQRELHDYADKLKKWIHGNLGSTPRPIESHLLMMLHFDEIMPPSPPSIDALRLALEVRQLAEQTALAIPADRTTHPYSEVVWKWIRTKVEKADKDRQTGENWLFGTDEKSWQNASEHLGNAKKQYESARADALAVQRALHIRDRVLAELPYYAQWVASQRLASASASRQKDVQEWTEQVERLGTNLDALVERLKTPTSNGLGLHDPLPADDTHPQRPALVELTRQVTEQVEELEQDFTQECRRFDEEGVDHQAYWHEIESALSIPLITDAKLRLTLLTESRNISNRLHEKRANFSGGALGKNQLQDLALNAAKRQGLMALAISGEPWSGRTMRDELANRMRKAVPEDWRNTSMSIGQQIAQHWQERWNKINAGFNESLNEPNLAQAEQSLQIPELYCRQIPGGAGLQMPADPFNPVQAARRLRAHDLLIWLAERTLADHWFTDVGGPDATYYEPAARACLTDAEQLSMTRDSEVVLNKQRKQQVVQKQSLVKLAKIVPDTKKIQDLTSEERFDLVYKFKVDEGVPQGMPMLWLDANGPFKDIKSAEYTNRVAVQEWPPQPKTYTLIRTQDNKEAPELYPEEPESGYAHLRGVYRGQRIKLDTALRVHKTPELIISKYPPANSLAHVAVQMEPDVFYGAISIVLDLSGSMDAPLGKDETKKKIIYAREALKQVLDKIPEQTYLSIQVFGQKTGPSNIEEDVAQTQMKWLRPPGRWSPRFEKAELINAINNLEPMNFSPIAEALVKAKDEGFPKNFKGPRVILALTDGTNNVFGGNFTKTYNPKEFLREKFKNKDVEVNVICFSTDTDEVARARSQFEIGERTESLVKFLDVTRAGKLAEEMEKALRPKLRLYRTDGTIVKGFEDGLIARPVDKNLESVAVEVNPEVGTEFEAKIHQSNLQQIRLRAGEYMIITLARGQDGNVIFRRALAAEQMLIKQADLEQRRLLKKDWSVAFLQNWSLLSKAVLEQLVVFEDTSKRSPAGKSMMQHSQPGFVWLEIRDRQGKMPKGLRWYNVDDICAPAFRVKSGPWSHDRPRVSLWWSSMRPASDRVVRTLEHDPKKDRLIGARERPESVPGSSIILEKVSLEDRWVNISPTKRERRPCLVVQIQYEAGKPVYLQLPDLGYDGEEHHYYSSAGKYTAFFWDVPREAINLAFHLNVISVDAFKNAETTVRGEPDWMLPEPMRAAMSENRITVTGNK